MFSHAWNMVAETLLSKFEIKKKDSNGNVIIGPNGKPEIEAPVLQNLVYAIIITIMSVLILWFIHYYTNINLASGYKRKHRY